MIPSDLLLELDTLREPTLETFVAEGNEEILEAMRELARGGGEPPAVVVWGPAGSGKSHLLEATAALARTNGLAVSDGEADAGDCDLLVADNAERMGDEKQMLLLRALDSAKTRGRPAVLAACGDAPANLPMRDDLRTRLGQCLVIGVRRLSDEAKARALASYAKRLGRSLPEEVADYLVMRKPRDLTGLLGELVDLDRYALLRKKSLTLRTAREWNEQRESPDPGAAGR